MVFKRKATYFLDLSGDDASSGATKPVTLAVREPKPTQTTATPTTATQPAARAEAPSQAAPAAQAAAAQPMLTTAEAIAAELRAAQEALPPPSTATFAPDSLNPANALPRQRRRAGANLAGFKAMGAGLLRS